MNRTTLALLAGLLVLAVGSALAQPAAPAPAVEKNVQVKVIQRMAGPELSKDQQKQLLELKIKLAKEIGPLMADLKVKRLELQALWSADEPDAGKIVAKAKEIHNLAWQVQEKRINHRIASWKVLTPEQREKMGPMPMRGRMMGCGMMGGEGCGMMGGEGCGMMGGEGCGMMGSEGCVKMGSEGCVKMGAAAPAGMPMKSPAGDPGCAEECPAGK